MKNHSVWEPKSCLSKVEHMAAEQLWLRPRKAGFDKELGEASRLNVRISVPRATYDLKGRRALLDFIFAGAM